MAIIYEKTITDKTLILSPREGVLRQFDFGSWTQMRLGIFWSMVSSVDDNAKYAVAEFLTYNTPLDSMCVGIKNADTQDLPGETGAQYMGLFTRSSLTFDPGFGGPGPQSIYTTAESARIRFGTGYDTTANIAASVATTMAQTPNSPAGASAYCGFLGMEFTINNPGLASQTVTMRYSRTSDVAGTDYGIGNLRSYLNAFASPFSIATGLAWNDGASAYTIPDGIFIRSPFYQIRPRISSMMMIRYA